MDGHGFDFGNVLFYPLRAVNVSGVPSADSAEKGIVLSAAPAGFAAVNNGAGVDLSWSVVGGATRYHLYRADRAGGPYHWISSPVTTTATDLLVVPYRAYYYVVTAEFASGLQSIPSIEATVFKSGSLKFVIPVELIDRGLASRSTESKTLEDF